MEFKVSKKKFIQNELLISILVLITLSIIFKIHLAFCIILFLWIFIYKETKYYSDLLYINEKCIKLKKYKRYDNPGSGGHASKIVKEEYNVINLERFKENYNQFVLYGNIEIRKTIKRRKIFNDSDKIEEYKTAEKLIIRKK